MSSRSESPTGHTDSSSVSPTTSSIRTADFSSGLPTESVTVQLSSPALSAPPASFPSRTSAASSSYFSASMATPISSAPFPHGTGSTPPASSTSTPVSSPGHRVSTTLIVLVSTAFALLFLLAIGAALIRVRRRRHHHAESGSLDRDVVGNADVPGDWHTDSKEAINCSIDAPFSLPVVQGHTSEWSGSWLDRSVDGAQDFAFHGASSPAALPPDQDATTSAEDGLSLSEPGCFSTAATYRPPASATDFIPPSPSDPCPVGAILDGAIRNPSTCESIPRHHPTSEGKPSTRTRRRGQRPLAHAGGASVDQTTTGSSNHTSAQPASGRPLTRFVTVLMEVSSETEAEHADQPPPYAPRA
ncbi:hypothetical protein OH77DRAFT_1057208 [Trametes cingulata]|nr:hypothetical protein OH77DRAFT_1057208 [Trametes cingulata]